MTLSEVNTEIRALFNGYWSSRTPVYYENENFEITKEKNGGVSITEYIRLTIEEIDNNLIGLGNGASGRLKRANCFAYIDYFFKPNTDVVTINEVAEGIIQAISNKPLTQGNTFEASRTPIVRTTNKSFNMIRITLNLDYENLTS